jgi:predicted RNA-binding protein YlqC (UPF0109 family)
MAVDLAEFIIRSIVGQAEGVSITESERNGKRILNVKVDQRDMARVMGSRGLVIRAIRTLVTSAPDGIEDVVVEAISTE